MVGVVGVVALGVVGDGALAVRRTPAAASRRRDTRHRCQWSSVVGYSDLLGAAAVGQPGDELVVVGAAAVEREIGRASCRERVEISVVAVSLKNKTAGGDEVGVMAVGCVDGVEVAVQ